MKCPDCEKDIVRIERYKTTVCWEYKNGKWEISTYNQGSHFHLYCPDYDEYSKSGKHEYKLWPNELPEEIERVVWRSYKEK